MKDTQVVHAVVHRHASDTVSATAVVNRSNSNYDAWCLDANLEAKNSSSEAFAFLTKHKQKIITASDGVLRIWDLHGSSGTSCRIAPNHVVTNQHVYDALKQSEDIYHVNNAVCPWEESGSLSGNIRRTPIWNGIDWIVRNQFADTSLHNDPILGHVGNFDFVDLTIHNFAPTKENHVLFVPAIECVAPDTPIITISYPGIENYHYEYLNRVSPSYISYVDFDDLETAIKFGKKHISYGRSLYPYHLDGDEWVANKHYAPTIESDLFILSNENLFFGSSGGVVLTEHCLNNITEHKDKQGNTWTLIPFNGIHFGGEFIPCSECLSTPPTSRRTKIASQTEGLNSCTTCLTNKERSPLSYNYAISVHHPAVVQFYHTHMVPVFKEIGLYPAIEQYLQMHPLRCYHCNKISTKVLRCKQCRQAFYCSYECHVTAWKTHKLKCKRTYDL